MGGIGLWRAVVVVGFSLCAAAPAFADIDMAALYNAAKQEGALNLYGGGPRAPYLERAGRRGTRVCDRFNHSYCYQCVRRHSSGE